MDTNTESRNGDAVHSTTAMTTPSVSPPLESGPDQPIRGQSGSSASVQTWDKSLLGSTTGASADDVGWPKKLTHTD